MKNSKRIAAKWIFIAMFFGAICWAFVIALIAKKIQNPDGIISVITVLVLVVFITVYLFVYDIKNSVEIKDEDDQN
jgi:CHASE2 domain-containing sensor protein